MTTNFSENLDIFVNGVACLTSIWFAAHHSLSARKAATAIFFGWLFYIWAWAPNGYNPRDIIYYGTGEKIKSPQLWAMMDCVVGLYIANLAIHKWWGFVLWLSFTIQVIFHILRLNDVFDFAVYSAILDKIFIIQIAVFLVLGWPNVRMVGSDFIDRWRHVFNSPQPASRKTQKVGRNGRT